MVKYNIKKLINNARAGIGFIIIAALLAQIFNVVQYVYTRKTIKYQTAERTFNTMQKMQRVATIKVQVETAVQNAMGDVQLALKNPDKFYGIVSRLVELNDNIVGSAIAMKPDFYPNKDRLFSPFAYPESADGKSHIFTKLLPYDYTTHEWFKKPFAADSATWSEPYADTGGSELLIRTYSLPIHDKKGQVVGILTADVHYEQLTIEENPLYSSIDKVNLVGFCLQFLGLLLVIYIVLRYMGKLRQINHLIAEQEIMSKELQIASDIQDSMLPKTSDVENIRHQIEVKDCLIPAPDVSADFYDYLYVGSKMVFCIGDVPGSNVKAALMMSIMHSVFRSAVTIQSKSGMPLSPAAIVSSMNNAICSINHNEMFSTLLVGMLDTKNALFTYCNAGNPNPFVLSPKGARMLDVEPNVPVGIVEDFEYVEQKFTIIDDFTLFLYNDGLYETENTYHEVYGMKRLTTRLNKCAVDGDDPDMIVNKMCKALENHRGSATQTDDVLMLAMKIL